MSERWGPYPPAVAQPGHLDDVDLVTPDRSVPAEKHLAECLYCRSRLHSVSERGSGLESLLKELRDTPVAPEHTARLSGWVLPSRLAQLLADSSTIPPRVQPGQVWRLSWENQQMIAVVLGVHRWWAEIAPLTPDVTHADEYSLVLSAEATALSVECAVFTRARGDVPLLVFDGYLGELDGGAWSATQQLSQLVEAHQSLSTAPESVTTGRALHEQDWDRQSFLDALDEDVAFFQTAAFKLAADEEAERDAAEQDSQAADVVALLASKRFSLAELHERSGITTARLVNLSSRRVQPTTSERAALERAYEIRITDPHQTLVRAALLDELTQPYLRQARTAWLHEHGNDPRDVLPLMLKMLEETPAARSVPADIVTPRDSDEPEQSEQYEQWRQYWRSHLAFVLHQEP